MIPVGLDIFLYEQAVDPRNPNCLIYSQVFIYQVNDFSVS